ncbi:MAG: LD-carboxypeptidase, partial [Geodermatophilaceae bacterium]|nr:LD-carboxypeptidase [Geodermatophilaceae bacterium]
MEIRYPAPLRLGDRIGVMAPSSGVPQDLRPRLDFCVDHLRRAGYEVVVGSCMDGSGVVSASARARAEELTGMLADPSVRAVVPPWGGELAVEV